MFVISCKVGDNLHLISKRVFFLNNISKYRLLKLLLNMLSVYASNQNQMTLNVIIKQGLSYISPCQLWILYNSKNMYVSSFHFVLSCFVTSIEPVFWSISVLFLSFSYISYSFHLLRNSNWFIKKDVCFVVSVRFTLFRNEHISNVLVCFILFQSFAYISYPFNML